jgi:uncharacterized membrane protein YjgN (DUF898 family)
MTRMSFEGAGGELFGKTIGGLLLSMITAGIYAPWFMCSLLAYYCDKSNISTAAGPMRLSFRGKGGSLFGVLFVGGLLTTLTAGIYAPWFVCKLARYFTENTVAQGQDGRTYRLHFTGEGGSLFGTWIVTALLLGITFGIYTPWAMCKMRRWFFERAQILENEQPAGQLGFVGEGGSLFGTWLGGAFLTLITVGIYSSWFKVSLNQFYYRNTRITLHGRTYALDFKGTGGDLFVLKLVGGLLTALTFGVYWFWARVKVLAWQYQNTSVTSAS